MKKGIILRMPGNLYQDLKKIAGEKGVTMTGLILHVLWEFIDEKQNKEE